jgi:hypothetical protein
MIKAFWVLLIVIGLFFESCRNDFNINAPYDDVYVLNCVLYNYTSIQYALISKNYFTENGAPPPLNSIEQNIKGSNIQIHYDNSVFVMRDSTFQLADSGNEKQVNCYYLRDLALSPGKVITIEAAVPNGKILKSTTQVPNISYINFSPNFPQLNKEGKNNPRPDYTWKWNGSTLESTTILDLPQLEVYYKQYEQGTYIDKKVLIPLAFYFTVDKYGNLSPVEVELSFRTYCVTTRETVDKIMQNISGDDPNKENYIITKIVFSVIGLDPELSKYYSTYATYSENFTIKLRQTDFSNIDGGKGIFGVSYKFSKSLVVDSNYIESFGYVYDPY